MVRIDLADVCKSDFDVGVNLKIKAFKLSKAYGAFIDVLYISIMGKPYT